jgi:NitT/TauT family transport system ATP-binding protein
VSGGPQISLRAVEKRFGAVAALGRTDLAVAAGELVCLLGPSGCGKSTLLNLVAGFVAPSAGEVLVGGRAVAGPGPDRAMVFQEYALFPWMTVAQNVAFGLRLKGLAAGEIDRRVEALLARFGLEGAFHRRYPRELSGGMQQRVAIARALALDPPILLMDEPFGALDALTRRTLQAELLRVWAELRQTILFVTHSLDEALFLADRVLVMTSRPGVIRRDQRVALPRPRERTAPEMMALERELGALVMEEQERHLREERAK